MPRPFPLSGGYWSVGAVHSQGPCPENQSALVTRNVTSDCNRVLQTDVNCAPKLVFEMRCAATLTLLSLLEGCNDPSRPKLIASTIQFTAVRDILDSTWDLVKDDATSGVSLPEAKQVLLNLAFNLFILMYQLQSVSAHKASASLESCSGYAYFRSLLGIIEIARGKTLEKVYFQIPSSCMYLRRWVKKDILSSIDRTSPVAKVTSFLDKAVVVGSKITYHRKMTEWLEQSLPLREFCEQYPALNTRRTYFIHQRDMIRERARHVTLYMAMVLNILVAFLRKEDREGRDYGINQRMIIVFLGVLMLGMTTMNSVLWIMAKAFSFKQQVLELGGKIRDGVKFVCCRDVCCRGGGGVLEGIACGNPAPPPPPRAWTSGGASLMVCPHGPPKLAVR